MASPLEPSRRDPREPFGWMGHWFGFPLGRPRERTPWVAELVQDDLARRAADPHPAGEGPTGDWMAAWFGTPHLATLSADSPT
jgi:hypothetical protein